MPRLTKLRDCRIAAVRWVILGSEIWARFSRVFPSSILFCPVADIQQIEGLMPTQVGEEGRRPDFAISVIGIPLNPRIRRVDITS